MIESPTILTPTSAQAEDARQAGAEPLNGNGFYRFKIGDFNPVTSLQHPDWTPVFDYEPAQAIKSRKAILDRVATDGVMVMGYHFPFPAIGHVVRHGTAYRWETAQWTW